MQIPSFDLHLPFLNQFILELVEAFQAGKITSWHELAERVNSFFTAERIEEMEVLVPRWHKMASYADGLTLVHVMCVFLGLFMLPEFQNLTREQQQLAKWMVLFHDVEKEIKKGERDPKHGFRSAVVAAKQLPHLGFAVTSEYHNLIDTWSAFTYTALKVHTGSAEPIQDNEKLLEILGGIEKMFGKDSRAALIIKCVLLHMSINVVRDWPQVAPLTEVEIKQYITTDLAPLLKVMMLSDNEGWVLFYPEVRELQRKETLEAFQKVEKIITA